MRSGVYDAAMRVKWENVNELLTMLLVLSGMLCLVVAAYKVSPILGIAGVGVMCLILARAVDAGEPGQDDGVPDNVAPLTSGVYANGVRR